MSNILRKEWIAICREFLENGAAAFSDGKNKQWIEINGRRIEVTFIDHDDYLTVQIDCPEVHRTLRSHCDYAAHYAETAAKMILWLAFDAKVMRIYEIDTLDPVCEYRILRKLLVENYRKCYDAEWEDEYWRETGERVFMIRLYDRQIKVHFFPSAMWDIYHSVDVSLLCLDTGRIGTTVVFQDEDDPEELIRLIQNMVRERSISESVP